MSSSSKRTEMRDEADSIAFRFLKNHYKLNVTKKAPVTFYSLTFHSLLRARKIGRGKRDECRYWDWRTRREGACHSLFLLFKSLKYFRFLPKLLILAGKIIFSQSFFLEGHQIKSKKHSFNNIQRLRVEVLKL